LLRAPAARGLAADVNTQEAFMSFVVSVGRALCVVIVALATVLAATPSSAETVGYMAGNGDDANPCTAAQPCRTIAAALGPAGATNRVFCVNPANTNGVVSLKGLIEIDCAGVWSPGFNFAILFESGTIKIRNMTFSGKGGATNAIFLNGPGGTVIFENCTFEDFTSVALDFEPNAPLNVVIRNSRISTNSSGFLLKPAAGGSIHATLDHVAISGNSGGGIKIDTTNGPVTTDITDSIVSDNGGNGINAIGGAGGQNIVSIKNSVIAKNGAAGVQANGANAGVLLQTTLLDQNAAGATTVLNGGNMFTYGNNSIVGSAGSGFNHTAGLQ
jgi:hypothetical protein